ncbi:MAG: AMP nucleosidase, partial [Caulobacteraceae bacterium]|nr:AMP nucleosidase [Caulobacteraceae bacterium]
MTDPAAIVARLNEEYRASVEALRGALQRFLDDGLTPDPALRAAGAFNYPELRLTWPQGETYPRLSRAYARLSAPGRYAVTVTRPDLFGDYLIEQLTLLMKDFAVEVSVARSAQEIPFPYVLDGSVDLAKADVGAAEIARHFPTTELARIGDEIADGFWEPALEDARPLALFDGLRTD